MIKQTMIQELTLSFGSSKGARFQSWVQNWVEEQLKRGIVAGDEWVFIDQIGFDRMLAATNVAIDGIQADSRNFFEWVWALPVRNCIKNNLTVIVEFRQSFFEHQLEAMGINVVDYGVIRSDDIINQTGSFEHISVDCDAGASGPVEAHFINVVNASGMKGSLVISECELQHIRNGQIEFKYGGIDPFNEKEWQEVVRCCLLRRFATSSLFDGLYQHNEAAYKALMYAINHHNGLYVAGMKKQPDNSDYHYDRGMRFKVKTIFSDMQVMQPTNNKDKQDSADNVIPMTRKSKAVNSQPATYEEQITPVYASDITASSSYNYAEIDKSECVYVDQLDEPGVLKSDHQNILFTGELVF